MDGLVVCVTSDIQHALSYMSILYCRYYIEWSDNPIDVVEELCGNVIPELLGDEHLNQSTIFPTLNL